MNAHEYLSDDGQAIMALCSAFGLPKEPAPEVEPFKLAEWNQLAKRIAQSALKRPAAMSGRPTGELVKDLGVSAEDAERIVRLLDRSSPLSSELETIFSLGMWVVTRADELYPAKLRDTLKHQAPTVLFGAGNIRLMQRTGVAVVGSRNIDETGAAFAREAGRKIAAAGLPVISGGARGTDRLAMEGAIESDGIAFGVLADSLERTSRQPDIQQLLSEDQLVLLTPYAPTAGFSVGAAMGRNKVIYGLSDFAVVVSSDFKTGGTWSGAVEALKAGWCPVFVRTGDGVPKGNDGLLKLGGTPIPQNELRTASDLPDWFRQHRTTEPVETDLFGMSLREEFRKSS
jgi:predicted Rossmann fold nucleotide-binding protein DprA/Smf involved in DNA uptake